MSKEDQQVALADLLNKGRALNEGAAVRSTLYSVHQSFVSDPSLVTGDMVLDILRYAHYRPSYDTKKEQRLAGEVKGMACGMLGWIARHNPNLGKYAIRTLSDWIASENNSANKKHDLSCRTYALETILRYAPDPELAPYTAAQLTRNIYGEYESVLIAALYLDQACRKGPEVAISWVLPDIEFSALMAEELAKECESLNKSLLGMNYMDQQKKRNLLRAVRLIAKEDLGIVSPRLALAVLQTVEILKDRESFYCQHAAEAMGFLVQNDKSLYSSVTAPRFNAAAAYIPQNLESVREIQATPPVKAPSIIPLWIPEMDALLLN